jgi:hypothetical protein
MSALLNNTPVYYNKNHISVLDRAETVCDSNGRSI